MTIRICPLHAGVFLLSLLASACASPAPLAPTTVTLPSPAGELTAVPSSTPAPSPTFPTPEIAPAPLETIVPTPSPTPTLAPTTRSTPCDDRASFGGDVSIRDGTALSPGETFVKIWRLQNAGTCSWSQEYSLTFFGGDRLGAPSSFPLTTVVLPGEMTDLAVDMIAPNEEGTYQGFWRLANPEGELFGIGPNGDESFWVKIVVEIPLVTRTPMLSPTTTPAVIASGILDLSPGSIADLDSGALDPAQGGDLFFEVNSLGARRLVPLAGALLESGGILRAPSPEACLTAALAPEPVPLVALGPGVSLCYQTGEGRPGLLIINLMNGTLGVSYITWAP